MGSCDCYFAWAEMRKNTSSLGGFFFFPPACSCQLRYTKILGAAGRHLAKKLKFAFTVRYIWAHHAVESTGSNVSAHLRWHSHLLHTVSASAAPEKDNPSHPGGTLASHPGQPSSQSPRKAWELVRDQHFGEAGEKGLNLSPSSSLSTFIINEELYLPRFLDLFV